MRYRRRDNAFTLIEAMLAVTVLGIAAAGVLLPFAGAAAVQAEGVERTIAAQLAGDLLEEIASKPFATAASYNGYSEAAGQIKDENGAVMTDASYAKFSRTVTCDYVYLSQQSGTGPATFILVTVSVSYGGKPMASIARLIAN